MKKFNKNNIKMIEEQSNIQDLLGSENIVEKGEKTCSGEFVFIIKS